MDAQLHRIEALPGEGRYAVTFRRADGSEQTAVFQVSGAQVQVAEASLPQGWTRRSEAYVSTTRVVQTMDQARNAVPQSAVLREVDGGWDVGLGNVVMSRSGRPECIAHGELSPLAAGDWECAECGARAHYEQPA